MQAEKSMPLKALSEEQGTKMTRMKPKLPTTEWVNTPLQTLQLCYKWMEACPRFMLLLWDDRDS